MDLDVYKRQAGVMIAPLTYARVDMSATIGMKAFAAAILGGIGNLWGALLGGIILGIDVYKRQSIDFSKEEFSQKLVDTLMALLRGEKAMDQYIPVSLCVRESA